MSDILDLIEGAIWDHGDAMRWTPETPAPPELPRPKIGLLRLSIANDVMVIQGEQYTADQKNAAHRRLRRSWHDVKCHLQEAFETIAPWVEEVAEQLQRDLERLKPLLVDSHGRVPYELLDEAEREALHQWCTDHRVDYKNVPIDGLIELDPAAGEWRIEIYCRNREGRFYLRNGDIARTVLRRAYKTDLPWRRPCPE